MNWRIILIIILTLGLIAGGTVAGVMLQAIILSDNLLTWKWLWVALGVAVAAVSTVFQLCEATRMTKEIERKQKEKEFPAIKQQVYGNLEGAYYLADFSPQSKVRATIYVPVKDKKEMLKQI